MGVTVLDRAVIELGVDGSKLFREAEVQIKGLAGRIKTVFGNDLKSSLKGLDDISGKVKGLVGENNVLANSFGGAISRLKAFAGGIAALGPVAGAAAIGVAAIAAASLAIVGALTAAGVAIYKATIFAANAGDELNTLSNKFSMTAESLSTLKFIADQADVPFETLTNSIFKLGQNMSEGGKKTQAAAKLIGTSLGELRKMTPEEAFQRVIKGLRDIPDAGQRAAAGVAFFGKQYREIAQLTREDMDKLAAKAKESGAVMSQEFAVAGDRFNDAMAVVRTSINGVVARFGEAFLPMGIALVETFGTTLVRALSVAGKSSGDFAGLVAKASVLIGETLAAIVFIGAGVAKWMAEFFGGRFLTNLAIIDKILGIADALLSVAKVATIFQPTLHQAFSAAEAKVASVRTSVRGFAVDVATVGGNISLYAKAVQDAADQTMWALPAAIANVRKEIKEQADAARDAIAHNTSFGESLGEDVAEGADKAAAALKKLKQEMRESLGEIRAVGAVLGDFGTRLRDLTERTEAWEQALPLTTLGQFGRMVDGYSVDAEIAATKTGMLEGAFKTLGLTSQVELQRMADEAKRAWQIIVQEFGAKSVQAKEAYQKFVDAANAATRTIPNTWLTEVLPRLKGVVENIGAAITGSFAQMLLGAKGFKDGFLDIWQSIKAGIGQILTSILQDFTGRFLKGILGALSGQKGAWSQAFSGMLNLGGAAGGGGAVMGGVPITGIGGTVGSLPGAGATAAGTGGTAGGVLAGGAAAAGAGIIMGMIGKKIFGGAGWKAGAFGAATGAATGALIGSVVPVLGTAIGAIIGGLAGAISGWIGKSGAMKVNDARDQELLKYGGTGTGEGSGFHGLHSKIVEATGSSALMEQFLKADTPEKYAAALEAVNKALADYKAKTDAAAAAEAKHAEEIDKVTAAHEERMDALKAEMQSLDDEVKKWDALEAPEEVMGVIEAEARKKIAEQQAAVQAAMDAQQQATEAALKAITDAAVESGAESGLGISDGFKLGWDKVKLDGQATGDFLDDLFRGRRYTAYIDFIPGDLPAIPMPSVPSFDRGSGGLRDFGAGTLAVLHGREEVRTEAQAKSSSTPPNVVNVYVNDEISVEQSRRIAAMIPGFVADGGPLYSDHQRMVRSLVERR